MDLFPIKFKGEARGFAIIPLSIFILTANFAFYVMLSFAIAYGATKGVNYAK